MWDLSLHRGCQRSTLDFVSPVIRHLIPIPMDMGVGRTVNFICSVLLYMQLK